MLLNLNDPSCENLNVHIGERYVYQVPRTIIGGISSVWPRRFLQRELVFCHEDYEISAKRALKVGGAHAKGAPANFIYQTESFHRAVALYAAALRTK